MAHATIAIATEDFAVLLDLAQHLRARNIDFEVIAPGATVPAHTPVVITTADEAARVPHHEVVIYSTPEATVEESVRRMKGLRSVARLVIGIDPGERPGVAVVADGHILSSGQIARPEHVVEAVRETVARFGDARAVVRVGHGAGTLRDRIVNELLGAGFAVELVDETSTSPQRARTSGERDAAAARAIAMTAGEPVHRPRKIRVPLGEVRDIQRRSRLLSNGDVTISRELARRVAAGAISLAEAVTRQRGEKDGPP